jgi:hypothetical protein
MKRVKLMMLMALTLATATNTKAQDEPKLEVKPTARILFDAAYITPDDEESLRKNGSYPSGHTILVWSSAARQDLPQPQN